MALGVCGTGLVTAEECWTVKNSIRGKLLVSLYIDGIPQPLEEEGPGSVPRLIPNGYTQVALPLCQRFDDNGGCIREFRGEIVGAIIMPTNGSELKVNPFLNALPSPNPQTRQCFTKTVVTYPDDQQRSVGIEYYDIIRGPCPDQFIPDLSNPSTSAKR